MSATTLAERRSWFDSLKYKALDKLEQVEQDAIFTLAGEMPFTMGSPDTVNWTSRAIPKYGQRVNPGADINRTRDYEGDTLQKIFVSYKDEMLIEREAFVHDKLGILGDEAADFAERGLNVVGLEMSRQLLTEANNTTMNVINNGSTQSVNIATADGLAPGSASHTRPGTGATTYSNILSGADVLSEDAIVSLEQQMKQNSVSEAGSHLGFRGDTLIVQDQAAMIRMALQISGSELVPGTANNAINVYSGGRLNVVVLKHGALDENAQFDSSSQYYWALADSKLLKRGFQFSWAVRPTQEGIGLVAKFSEDNLDQKIQFFSRAVFGMPDWCGIGYSFAASAPTSPGAQ